MNLVKDATEIPASWFGILNSFFIIAFAPLFSKWWESKYNPSAAVKYGIGLDLLGLGFGLLAVWSIRYSTRSKNSSVSMVWLILAYLFHTLGELMLITGRTFICSQISTSTYDWFYVWYMVLSYCHWSKSSWNYGGDD